MEGSCVKTNLKTKLFKQLAKEKRSKLLMILKQIQRGTVEDWNKGITMAASSEATSCCDNIIIQNAF